MAKRKGRNKKGQFVKGHKRRYTKTARHSVSANRPKRRKARRKATTRRRTRRNPPYAMTNAAPMALREVMSEATAAFVGGAAAAIAVGLANRMISNPTSQVVAGVVLPVLIGAAATQIAHPQAQVAAAGAFGVGGAMLGAQAASLVTRTNPPRTWEWDNPPRIAGPTRLVAGALPSAWKSPLRAVG